MYDKYREKLLIVIYVDSNDHLLQLTFVGWKVHYYIIGCGSFVGESISDQSHDDCQMLLGATPPAKQIRGSRFSLSWLGIESPS